MPSARIFLLLGAVNAFLSVALGAFAAHGLKSVISVGSLTTFHTGVDYHFIHALALILIGVLLQQRPHPHLRWVGWSFATGILLFSCSLYILAVTNIRAFGAITPIGGLSFLYGWALLSWHFWRKS